MSDLLKASVDLSCPEVGCGKSFRATLGDIQKGRTVSCPGGHQVKLVEQGSGISKVDRSLDGLKRSIKRTSRQLR